MGLQRAFNRRELFVQGKVSPKILEANNEEFAREGRVLHPTKGWRSINEKQGRAQMIIAEQLKGTIPPTIYVLPMIRKFITTGKW